MAGRIRTGIARSMAPSKHHQSTPTSTPIRTIFTPPIPPTSSQITCFSGGPRHSPVIVTDDYSSSEVASSPVASSRARPVIVGAPVSSSRTPSKIPGIISMAGSSPQSSGGLEQVLTNVRQSTKSAGKRSSHSINSHSTIVDEKPRDATRTSQKSTFTEKKSNARIDDHPNRLTTQPKWKSSKGLDNSRTSSKIPGPPGVDTDDVKKIMKVRFENKGNKSAPDSFIGELEYSDNDDDECRPPPTNKGPSPAESDDVLPLSQRSRPVTRSPAPRHMKSSHLSPSRTLRSRSYRTPTTSFTPINKPVPKARKRVLSRGYPERARNIFSDTSSLDESEGQTKENKVNLDGTILNSELDSEEVAATQLATRARNPQWSPRSWMEKYETGFMPDRTGGVWLADGPFKGWILDGTGAGSYTPGYKAPDNETLAEAEKTAVLRGHPTWTDSEDDYQSNVEHPPVPNASPEVLKITKSLAEADNKAAERAESMENTKQYVLTASRKDVDSQQKAGLPRPISSRTRVRLPANLAPTTTPKDVQSPPSATSDTTSILITKQLMGDCAPPSNQELAELISSSPMNRRANGSSPVQNFDDGHTSSSGSSTEPSCGIPARISPKTPLHHRATPTPPNRRAPFGSEHASAMHVLNGIAGRRTTRSMTSLAPSDVTRQRARSFEKASVGTRAKSPVLIKGILAKGKIVIELPALTVEQQAEYKMVSPAQEIDSFSTPPKSFKEINEATTRMDLESSDAEETLKYVLRQSPRWLNGITGADGTSDVVINAPTSSNAQATASIQKPSKDTSKPTTPGFNHKVSGELLITDPGVVASMPTRSQHTTFMKEPKRVIGEGSEKKKRKRKTPSHDVCTANKTPGKRQKIDDDQSPARGDRLSCRQRRRLRKRLQRQRQRQNYLPQQHIGKNNAKISNQSTVTPPATSRPTSSEAG
ncbi:hypothetical protein F4804DRAFT_151078 [Jackrogersella minutella]|nr:hypothetical protein F4804DRAFT_151078 [Jackrogersella minutella]